LSLLYFTTGGIKNIFQFTDPSEHDEHSCSRGHRGAFPNSQVSLQGRSVVKVLGQIWI